MWYIISMFYVPKFKIQKCEAWTLKRNGKTRKSRISFSDKHWSSKKYLCTSK